MKKNFTLIELLAVITILGILMGLAGAAVPLVLNKAYTLTCANNMKNLNDSAQAYASNQPLTKTFPGGKIVNGKSWVARLALISDSIETDASGNYFIANNRKALSMFSCTRDNSSGLIKDLAEGDENRGDAISLPLSYTFNAGPSDINQNYINRDVLESAVRSPASTIYLIETHGATEATRDPEADPSEDFALGVNPEIITLQGPNVLYKKDPIDATNKEFYKSRVVAFPSKIKNEAKEFINFNGRLNGVRGHGKESEPSIHTLMYDGSVELQTGRIKTDFIKYRK